MPDIVPVERIEKSILLIRGHKVMLDVTLAELYGVETGALVRAVKRNFERFPSDFMIALNNQEVVILRSQFGISSSWGGRRYLPYAFTELGVAMLSSVLRSKRAILVNIEIMRAFVRFRSLLASNKVLAKRLDDLERKYAHHDHQIKEVFDKLRAMMEPPPRKTRPMGFVMPARPKL